VEPPIRVVFYFRFSTFAIGFTVTDKQTQSRTEITELYKIWWRKKQRRGTIRKMQRRRAEHFVTLNHEIFHFH
jgi:hypothetical protein